MKLNKHKYYLDHAILVAKRSKCISHQVGCVIVKDDDIIVSGYNGTPPGYINCNDKFCDGYHESHHEWSNIHEIHAEQNAICRAARKGIPIQDAIIYSTLKPCMHCSKMIVMAGIKEIYYIKKYDRNDDNSIDEFLKDNNIKCEQIC